MSDPIELEVEPQAQEAAEQFEQLAKKLEFLDQVTRQTAEAAENLGKGMRTATSGATSLSVPVTQIGQSSSTAGQAVQQLAGRLQGLSAGDITGGITSAATAIRGLGSTSAGVEGSMAGMVGQLQTLGGSAGPVAAAAVTALTVAFAAYQIAVQRAQEEQATLRQRLEATTRAMNDQIQAAHDAEQRRIAALNENAQQTLARTDAETARAQTRLAQLNNEMRAAESERQLLVRQQAEFSNLLGNRRPELERAEERIRTLLRERQELQDTIETNRIYRQERVEAANEEIEAGQEAEAIAQRQAEAERQRTEAQRRAAEAAARRREEERRAEQERRAAAEAEFLQLSLLRRKRDEEDQRLAQAEQERQERLHAEKMRRAAEERAIEEELAETWQRIHEQERRLRQEQQEASQRRIQDYQQLTGVIAEGLTNALAQTIAGTKDAGTAFKEMLAGFLAALSQMAGLEAAKNYARAIEFFSTQRYDQGALAIAAGVAWTAVAVAAGGASIAVSPPAASAPASPETDRGGGGGGDGGTTIVNYNAPVVTTATRAELGREISTLVSEGQRRLAA